MKEFNMLIWLTQLGLSVAAPLVLCTLGALWLRNRFSMGSWVILAGIGLGLCLAVSGFRTSLRAMDRMGQPDKKGRGSPPVSFNDHQ